MQLQTNVRIRNEGIREWHPREQLLAMRIFYFITPFFIREKPLQEGKLLLRRMDSIISINETISK
jgi:hypothetical protein